MYDALNREVEVLYADGTKTLTGYDADGRKVADTEQDGIITQFGYDGAGRLIGVTNAFGKASITSLARPGTGRTSADHLPFLQNLQGATRSSVFRPVPQKENWIQGWIIPAAYGAKKIRVGDSFAVIVTP